MESPCCPLLTDLLLELWCLFRGLDLDGNGHLDSEELQIALENAGRSPRCHTLYRLFIEYFPRDHPLSHRLGRIHYILDTITPLSCYQLSTVSRLSITPSAESIDLRDLPVLRGEEVHGGRRKGFSKVDDGRSAVLSFCFVLHPHIPLTYAR